MIKEEQKNYRKIKPYLVYEYLMRYSDVNHVVSASELVGYLQECKIYAERRSIYRDIEEISKALLLTPFRMQAIKVDKSGVETYSDEELYTLFKKPNLKKCKFSEYQCWGMTNFLFSTAVRQRSLIHIRIKDIDFDNYMVHVKELNLCLK